MVKQRQKLKVNHHSLLRENMMKNIVKMTYPADSGYWIWKQARFSKKIPSLKSRINPRLLNHLEFSVVNGKRRVTLVKWLEFFSDVNNFFRREGFRWFNKERYWEEKIRKDK